MASFGGKKEAVKKDMNFFSEFTASAAKMARLLGYGIVAAIVVVGILVLVSIVSFVRNAVLQGNIDTITQELNSEEYQNLDVEAQNLAQSIANKQDYYYALTSMRGTVDKAPDVETNILDEIQANIPSDTIVTAYDLNGTTLSISGQSFSYYSMAEMVNLLNQSDVFTSVQIEESRFDPASVADSDTWMQNALDSYYQWTLTGTLVGDYYVSVTKYYATDTGNSAYGGVSTEAINAGESYSVDEVNTLMVDNTEYQLSSVIVNGVAVDDTNFATIQANNSVSGTATANVEIEFYYVLPGSETEASEEA